MITTDRRAIAIARLEQIPGVLGVYRGLRRRGGVWHDEETLSVHVVRKRAPRELDSSSRVPRDIEGFRTDVVAVGELRAHADVDTAHRLETTYDALERQSAISVLAPNPDGGILALGSGHGLLPVRGGTYAAGTFDGATHPVSVVDHPDHVGGLSFGNIGGSVDCAVVDFARLAPADVLLGHVFAPLPVPHAAPPALGDVVHHWGAERRNRVSGRVVNVPIGDGPIQLRTDAGIDVTYARERVVAVVGRARPFSVATESGSLVFDEARRAIGFVIGGGADPDDPQQIISFVLCDFGALRRELGPYFGQFFGRNPS